jgi:hypothetical protein
MSEKNIATFGIYHTREAAEEAVDALRHAGFRNTDISALFPDNAGTKDFAHEKNTKAPEGATTGATSGAVAGGVLGWLAGIGLLAIPRDRALHRSRADRSRAGRRRCVRDAGRNCWGAGGNGNSGI